MIVKTIQKTSENGNEQFEIVIVLADDHSEYWIIAQYTDPDGKQHSTIGSAHDYNDNPLKFPVEDMSHDAGKAMFAALANRNEPRYTEYIRGYQEEVFYNDLNKWNRHRSDFLQSPTFSWACDWLQVWKEDRFEKFLDLFRGNFQCQPPIPGANWKFLDMFRENIHFPFVSPEKKAELLAGRK